MKVIINKNENLSYKKIKTAFILLFILLFFSITWYSKAYSFGNNGCDGDCKKCHTLSKLEAGGILKKLKIPDAKIINIKLSPVKSLWELTIDDKGKRGLLYIDFSKKYILPGPIIEVSTGKNITISQNEKTQKAIKVDTSKIPLSNALVLGNKNASKKIIVFTDPDCSFCGRLHQEMKKVLQKRKDIVFYNKLYPLPIHKDAYWKSNSIVCAKSLTMLEDNFDNKPIKRTTCNTKEVDNNIKLAEKLGITGTPTFILPNGKMHSGTMPADELIKLIDANKK